MFHCIYDLSTPIWVWFLHSPCMPSLYLPDTQNTMQMCLVHILAVVCCIYILDHFIPYNSEWIFMWWRWFTWSMNIIDMIRIVGEDIMLIVQKSGEVFDLQKQNKTKMVRLEVGRAGGGGNKFLLKGTFCH